MSGNILVIGATLLDTKGQPTTGLEPNVSNPAAIRNARGGTARNVAENLALLGADVTLLSAVGDDITGRRLLAQTATANVNVEHVLSVDAVSTGSYIAIINEDGSLAVALNDTRVMEHVTPDFLYRQRDLFRTADLIMFDGSLSEHAIEVIIYLAEQYDVAICADPSSRRLTHKLQPHLAKFKLVAPNAAEAAALCDVTLSDDDSTRLLAQQLVQLGVDVAVVTIADFGFVYATEFENGIVPALEGDIVDTTGAGDAMAAAIIVGLLEGMPTLEAMRLGAAAGGLTLQSAETVIPDLSLDMLYAHLLV